MKIDSAKSAAWTPCASNPYDKAGITAQDDWAKLLGAGIYRVLQYSGNKDLSVPTIGTQRWIDALGLDITKDWCKYWTMKNMPEKHLGGFYKEMGALTFATVHGAGAFHMVD